MLTVFFPKHRMLADLARAHLRCHHTVVSLFQTPGLIPTDPWEWSDPLASSSIAEPFSIPFVVAGSVDEVVPLAVPVTVMVSVFNR